MKDSITVIFSSHLGDERNGEFIKHINKTIGCKHKIFCYTNYNEYSLTTLYNRAINEHYQENSIFVFCHPDIKIKTKDWGKILLRKFNHNDYGVIGIAGTTYLGEDAVWWNKRQNMYGIVEHTNGISEWVNEYSSEIKGIKDTVLVDGLFFSVDVDNIEHRFDESYKGFHFYDIPFCIKNYLDGVNIGVITDIRVLHESVGEVNDVWEINRKQFVEEYRDELPVKYLTNDNPLNILICCQFFNSYTGSEISNFELAKELVNMGNKVTIISSVVGEPLMSKAKAHGINVFDVKNSPNYIFSDNQFQFKKNEVEFDIIHINHKPIGELILKLYPSIPAVMHVRSEVIPHFEEPIINPNIKKYISIRESITEYIKGYGILDKNIVEIDNPFDLKRFNVENTVDGNSILFVGTLDYLRKNVLFDLLHKSKELGLELWIIGADNESYVDELTIHNNVKYFGIVSNVEYYVKKCKYTAGIFKGRTTIEGFLCGKSCYIYGVDKTGNISACNLVDPPSNLDVFDSKTSAKKICDLYKSVLC